MNELTPLPRLLHVSARTVRWLLWLVLAGWLLLAAAWGGLHGWIVPYIGDWRPRLERQATQALGVPVRIGEIRAESRGLVPAFELRDVALLDPQGREALRLPRVLAALSPRSVWRLGFEQLIIEQPVLDIRRAANGHLLVAGLDFSATEEGGSGAAEWFFSQTEFVIRGGTLRWTDEQRGVAPLALAQVDFVSRNQGRGHALRLDATPPPGWGERFSLMGEFRQPLLSLSHGRWQEWQGQLYADFPRVDISQLRRHADLGVDVSQGNGAVRAWIDVRDGQLVGATTDVALAEVDTTLGPGLQPLGLRSVRGRLTGRHVGSGYEVASEGLAFQTREGLAWPGGNLALSYQPAQDRLPAQGSLRGDRLDLAAVSQIANHLPLGAAVHNALRAYAPRGLVEQLQASWQDSTASQPMHYEARGRVSALDVTAQPAPAGAQGQAVPGTPGVRGASVDFALNEAGGKARLSLEDGALEFPGVFDDPTLVFDALSADLQWQVQGERLAVQVARLKFANADAEGEAHGSWQTSDPAPGAGARHARFPGVLDLHGSMERAEAGRVHRYLPLVLARPARDYVREAVPQGHLSAVKFRVKGALDELPFPQARQGEFRISARLADTTLVYVPPSLQPTSLSEWPALTQLAGELVFERQSLQARGLTARLSGAPNALVSKGEVQIPDLAHNPTVAVAAQVRGPLTELIGYVTRSPLNALLSGALAQARGSGDAEVRFKLGLPVLSIDKSKAQGTVLLAGNDVQISPGSPVLGRARASIAFSESGFNVAGAQVRVYGGDMGLDGGMRPAAGGAPADPPIVFKAQGVASAEGLRQARELGALARLAENASGSAAYSATLAFRRGQPELSVSSTLEGLALNLPAPFAKKAEAALPLRYDNSLLREPAAGAAGRLQDQIRLELGPLLAAHYVRDLSGPEPRVLRGSLAVGLAPGDSLALPAEGVAARLQLASLPVDSWRTLLARLGQGVGDDPATQAYLPTSLALRATEFTVGGRRLSNLVASGVREGRVWRGNVDAAEASGYLEYRQPSETNAGRLYARLARLVIGPGTASEVEDLLDEQPQAIPALDIVVDDLTLRGRKLGRAEVEAVNRGARAGAREWRLNKFNLTLPEATLRATGNWAAPGEGGAALPASATAARRSADQRRTSMNFALEFQDSGELLGRFGMKDVLRRGQGRFEGQIGWMGSPLSLDYPSLSGQFSVDVAAGQFLKADPGLAKLLGVLNLQALPRRLTLDFRDVFSEGFAFDFVRGDVHIEQGIATTNNLQMKGVNAAVLMEGKADIARETQDLRVVVVPEINAGTASLVATAINPAVGLGSFLAQLFLRRPLIQANTQEFHIDGTWADPRVNKVEPKAEPRGEAASESRGNTP